MHSHARVVKLVPIETEIFFHARHERGIQIRARLVRIRIDVRNGLSYRSIYLINVPRHPKVMRVRSSYHESQSISNE